MSRNSSVFEIVGNSKIFKTFWEPLTLGVMNTATHLASAKVLSKVFRENHRRDFFQLFAHPDLKHAVCEMSGPRDLRIAKVSSLYGTWHAKKIMKIPHLYPL